jgi:hypothetical protein
VRPLGCVACGLESIGAHAHLHKKLLPWWHVEVDASNADVLESSERCGWVVFLFATSTEAFT